MTVDRQRQSRLAKAFADAIEAAQSLPTRRDRRAFLYDLSRELKEWADVDSRKEKVPNE